MRKSVIIGNWKMNKTLVEAKEFINEIKKISLDSEVEKVVCVPSIYANEIASMLDDSDISVGVQNMYFEEKGAFTGEISPIMLKSCKVKYVILGHSERRTIFKEDDELINLKIKSALSYDLIPILCCGETLEEREQKIEKNVIEKQIKLGLSGVSNDLIKNVIIAYEPIWAIGTGLTASSDDAEDMIKFIRNTLKELYAESSDKIRIQYGGSVKPDNIKELMSKDNIDGALVGGACLEVLSFSKLINYKL